MNDNDKKIPEVEFRFCDELEPGELDFLIKKRDAIFKIIKENNNQIPDNIDDRLREIGLSTFKKTSPK